MACSCSPYIAVANTAVAEVPTGGSVPLGTLIGRECGKYRLAGDGIVIRGAGTCEVAGTVTLKPAAESGTAVGLSATLCRNGQPVQGGYARIDSAATVTLPFCVTVSGDQCSTTTVTVENSGADASVVGVSLVVRPIG